MSDVAEVRASYVLESSPWETGMTRIVQSTVQGGAQIETGLQAVQAEVADTAQAIGEAATATEEAAKRFSFQQAAQAGIASLQSLAGSLSGFRSELVEAAGQADDLADHLQGVFGNAAEEMAALSEQQIVIGIDPEAAASVLTTLNKFKLASAENLTFVEDAAAKTGVPMGALAEKIGRIAELSDSKAYTSLAKNLGASVPVLKSLGAEFDNNNKVLLDTPERLQAAIGALREFGQTNFSGAAAAMADDTTKLQGELRLLKQEIGGNIVAFEEGFAPAGRTLVSVLRDLPGPVKTFVGLGTEFVTVGASMATTGLQVATNVSLLTTNTALMANAQRAALAASGAFQGGLTALLGAMSPLVIILGSVAIGLAVYTAELEKSNKAAEDLLATEERRAQNLKANKDLIGQSAEDLKRQGRDLKDVNDVILGLQDQIQAARNAGNTSLVNKLQGQVRELIQVRSELGKLIEADGKNQDGATSSDPSKSVKQQKADEAKALKEANKAADQLTKDLAKAQREADKEAENARKEALANRLADIKNQATAGEISKQQEIAALQAVLKEYHLVGAEKRSVDASIAALKGQLRAEQSRADETADRERTAKEVKEAHERETKKKKAEADAKKAADQAAATEKENTADLQRLAKEKADAEKAAIDTALKSQEEKLGENSGALKQVEALLEKRLQLVIAEINAQKDAEIAATKSELVKAAAVATAESKIQAARAASTQAMNDAAKKQKDALQSVADKQKSVVAEINDSIKSLVGGPASNIFSNPNEGLGINLGSFAFTDLKKPQELQVTPRAEPSAKAPEAKDVGKEVASALKDGGAVSITVEVHTASGKKSQTFAGTAKDLAQARNTFNPDFDLGGF